MSTGVEAMKMPESPPMTNIETKASAFSIGTVNCIRAPHIVPSQVKVWVADGTAVVSVVSVKGSASAGPMLVMKIWAAETSQERDAVPVSGRARAWLVQMV